MNPMPPQPPGEETSAAEVQANEDLRQATAALNMMGMNTKSSSGLMDGTSTFFQNTAAGFMGGAAALVAAPAIGAMQVRARRPRARARADSRAKSRAA